MVRLGNTASSFFFAKIFQFAAEFVQYSGVFNKSCQNFKFFGEKMQMVVVVFFSGEKTPNFPENAKKEFPSFG